MKIYVDEFYCPFDEGRDDCQGWFTEKDLINHIIRFHDEKKVICWLVLQVLKLQEVNARE